MGWARTSWMRRRGAMPGVAMRQSDVIARIEAVDELHDDTRPEAQPCIVCSSGRGSQHCCRGDAPLCALMRGPRDVRSPPWKGAQAR